MNSNRDTIRTDTSDTIRDTNREDGRAGAYLLSGKMVELPATPTGKMVVLVAIFHHDYQQGHHQGCKDPEGYQRTPTDTNREDGSAGAYLPSYLPTATPSGLPATPSGKMVGKMVELPTATPERTPTGKMVVLVAIFHHDYQQRHHQGCKDPEGYQRTPTDTNREDGSAGAWCPYIHYILYYIRYRRYRRSGKSQKGRPGSLFFLLYILYII